DSRLQQTAERLHNLVGNPSTSNGSIAGNSQLAQHPVIRQLQSNMATLQSTVDAHGQQIGAINTTLASAAEDSRATREMMERMMAMPHRPPVTPQRGPPRPPALAPSSLAAPGGGPAGLETAAATDEKGPLVKPQMTVADHEHALAILGIGARRQNMTQLGQEVASTEGAMMPFSEWWTQVARCKRHSQWQTELQAMGLPADNQASASHDGTWSDTDLQTITLS
ncbi:unnamed protein product, partial [Prorocentrum cordatum]